MGKFEAAVRRRGRAAVLSSVRSTRQPVARTHQGGPGYGRDAKSELFVLAVANFVSEGTFYEQAGTRDARFDLLIRQVMADDAAWVARLGVWLRTEANMRSAPLVVAANYVAETLLRFPDGNVPEGWTPPRQVVRDVLRRADEPSELLALWQTRFSASHTLPKPIKRGVSDAVARLYNERNALKWDGQGRAWRMADVIEMTKAVPGSEWQSELYRWLIERRHNRAGLVPPVLEMISTRRELEDAEPDVRRALVQVAAKSPDSYAAGQLKTAGATWEWLAGWLQGPMDRAAWEAIIPSMGYMALLRNLRNFDQAGIDDTVAEQVARKLADPDEVAKSKQFPFRFLAAHQNAPSFRWAHALEQALGHSLVNVPALSGRTLVLVDRSGSMWGRLSDKGELNRADAAAIFGSALAQRAESADLVEFGTSSRQVHIKRGSPLLKVVGQFSSMGGTNTYAAVKQWFKDHDRVVIVTDEQSAYSTLGVGEAIPSNVPMYTWNLAGYRFGHAPSGGENRHTFAGLTDQAFKQIPLLEAARAQSWPF